MLANRNTIKELLEARIPLAQPAYIPTAGGTSVRDGGVGEGTVHGGNDCGRNAGIGWCIDGGTTLLVDLGSCLHNEGIIRHGRSRVVWDRRIWDTLPSWRDERSGRYRQYSIVIRYEDTEMHPQTRSAARAMKRDGESITDDKVSQDLGKGRGRECEYRVVESLASYKQRRRRPEQRQGVMMYSCQRSS